MNLVLHIVLAIVLLIIFIQDYRYRAIHISLIFIVFFISTILWYNNQYVINGVLWNLFFLLVNFLSLKLYVNISKKKVEKDLYFGGLGLGDVLFFVVVCPLFSIVNYMLFFVSGIIFSIVLHLVNRLISKNKYVPLAGYLSLYLILILVGVYAGDFNMYINLL